MTRNMDNENSIDPELIEKINLMGPTPDRDPLLASQGREKFISQLEGMPGVVPKSSLAWLTGLFRSGNSNPGEAINRKFAVSTLVALIVVVVMLFGGASVTAYASQAALPGDALYPVKTSLESTQISLTNDAYRRAQLHLEFAQRRMDEITELLQQGRTNDIEFAAGEFEDYLQKAMEATQIVLTNDPERGAELSKLVSQALLDYAVALKSVLVSAPEVVKPAVEKVFIISQNGAGDEIEIVGVVDSISDTELVIDGETYRIHELTEVEDMIKAGDNVKVHVILTADGLMIAREIELASVFDDISSEQENSNVNENEDFSGNENGNENFNDNASDDSENDNESKNNANDNDEDIENENKSDSNENNGESNDNGNDNESDDGVKEDESEDKGNDNRSDDSNEADHSEDNSNNNDSSDKSSNDNEKDDD